MSTNKAPQRPSAPVGSTRNFAYDLSGWLDTHPTDDTQDEFLVGTPLVTEAGTSDLSITSKSISTTDLVIDHEIVAAGKAVQFSVSGMLASGSPYTINIIATSDSSPAQVLPVELEFTT